MVRSALALAAIGTLLPAIAHAAEKLDLPLERCGETALPRMGAACFADGDIIFGAEDFAGEPLPRLLHDYADEPWAARGRPPHIGLALAGGGSKSAPFAMGVLKRFAEEGWLSQTDLLSSVSGGGYSAYFLYSHAWMREKYPDRLYELRRDRQKQYGTARIQDFFADTRRESYGEGRKDLRVRRDKVLTPDAAGIYYGQLEGVDESCRRFPLNSSRHQHWVTCFQDILSSKPGGVSSTVSEPPWGSYVGAALATAVLLPAHHLANSVFDWKVDLSPSRWIYRRGIGRTYGVLPGQEPDAHLSSAKLFTFEGLRALYDSQCPAGCESLPWWIINNTNDVVGNANRTSLGKTVFEMTPSSFGSGTYGYVKGVSVDRLEQMTVLDAVATSGAFFDSLSAYQPIDAPEWAVFGALHAFNIRWGFELPNYRKGNAHRLSHALLPWPIYYLHGFRRNERSNYIRIADGGQSGDNVGAYSLLRRATTHIVIADGSNDVDAVSRTSELSDLCMLSSTLGKVGYDIEFEGYPDGRDDKESVLMGDICDIDSPRIRRQARRHFNPYEWEKPVWVGRLRPISNEAVLGARVLLGNTRIYYLKSAFDYDAAWRGYQAWRQESSVCSGGNVLAEHGYPCGMVGYLIDTKWFYNRGDLIWPQNSTVWKTANSSANTFKSYRDLGWYVAGQLACVADSPFFDEPKCKKYGRSDVATDLSAPK